jgi:hypothetical protein
MIRASHSDNVSLVVVEVGGSFAALDSEVRRSSQGLIGIVPNIHEVLQYGS